MRGSEDATAGEEDPLKGIRVVERRKAGSRMLSIEFEKDENVTAIEIVVASQPIHALQSLSEPQSAVGSGTAGSGEATAPGVALHTDSAEPVPMLNQPDTSTEVLATVSDEPIKTEPEGTSQQSMSAVSDHDGDVDMLTAKIEREDIESVVSRAKSEPAPMVDDNVALQSSSQTETGAPRGHKYNCYHAKYDGYVPKIIPSQCVAPRQARLPLPKRPSQENR